MKMRTGIVIALMGLIVVSCGSGAIDDDGPSNSEDSTTSTESDEDQQADPEPPDTIDPGSPDTTRPDRGDPNAEPAPGQPDPVVGEVPDEIMEAIMEDATDRTGVAASDLEVVRAQAMTWSDGSLGCPQPGEVYTQALVNGYWVELVAGEERLDYRVDDSGFFKLCEGQQTPHSTSDGDAEGTGTGGAYGSGEEIGPPGGSPES